MVLCSFPVRPIYAYPTHHVIVGIAILIMSMRVLFVHQNFPAQYLHLAPTLAAKEKAEVIALCTRDPQELAGVRTIRYGVRPPPQPTQHPWVGDYESKVVRGEGAALAAMALRKEGFKPDVICVHPGWGEQLFLRDVWPEARILSFFEFFYAPTGSDVGFDPEFHPRDPERDAWRIRVKNAALLQSIEGADWNVSPTLWQANQAPPSFRDRVTVVHDGINTELVRPNNDAYITFRRGGGDEITLRKSDEILTFVNRNLEPYRGYHVLMRALPEIQKRRPNAKIMIVGGDGVSYGRQPPKGTTYKQYYLDQVKDKLDMSRIFFLGKIQYNIFLNLLQISSAHIYMTYPFVLSWSMLEAMSAGCLLIGSNTPPVREMINPGEHGLIVDFFDVDGWVETISKALENPNDYLELRKNARQHIVDNYDLNSICLPKHVELVKELAAGNLPPKVQGLAASPLTGVASSSNAA